MGEVVHLATWTSTSRAGLEATSRVSPARREPPERRAGETRLPVARVRPILGEWHPSLGPDDGSKGRARSAGERPANTQIARLERAVTRIDGVTAKISSRGGSLEPDVETELLALVGEISLGLLDAAADRAERLARGLGGAALRP